MLNSLEAVIEGAATTAGATPGAASAASAAASRREGREGKGGRGGAGGDGDRGNDVTRILRKYATIADVEG